MSEEPESVSPGRQRLMDHRDELLGQLPGLDRMSAGERNKVLRELVLAEAALAGGKVLVDALKGINLGLEAGPETGAKSKRKRKIGGPADLGAAIDED